ncbi:phosphatase PAP2 family protein [Williamsia phyllosphaerae]|uniref:Phosphatidic acid phosphatase n=1 Tax=Williamsia phyllosphaerae TaxID=885042 RepID=A0ABQ1UAW5_9NOCA|nr:phosphatidic acid phosphatase [Williamsia phyllosphaerae]
MTISEADRSSGGTASTPDGSAAVDVPESPTDDHQGSRSLLRNLRMWRYLALTVWLAVLVWQFIEVGLAFDRTRLILWMCLGLAAASIGRRQVITVLVDWLPFVGILMLYDLTRNVAQWMGMPTHWHLAVDADHALFGVNPTVWLQGHIKMASPPWWEVFTSVVYISYFVVPYVVAGVLWLRDRSAWRRYAVAFVATTFLALVVYTLVPGAPPWAAARCSAEQVADHPRDPDCMYTEIPDASGGLLGPVTTTHPGAQPYVERISARGWEVLDIRAASTLISVGQSKANLVAAIPSLHAGLTMLLALFMWPRVRALGRTLFLGYAVVMAFTLVYTGEHYVFDIIAGWGLAAAVIAVQYLYLRRRGRKGAEPESTYATGVSSAA